MLTANLADKILFEPILQGADTLNIIAGSAAPTMASWYLTSLHEMRDKNRNLPITHVHLIVGRTAITGLPSSVHSEFRELSSGNNNFKDSFSCSYVYGFPAIRSNLYVWLEKNDPVKAFMGSAPFEQSAFLPSNVQDAVQEVDPKEAYKYYSEIEGRTIYCTHAEVENNVRINAREYSPQEEVASGNDSETVTLSLLTKKGVIGIHSGLNWGQRETRNPNQAYIPVPAEIVRKEFFPNNKRHFTVLTDDHKSLIVRLEQANDKALTTPLNNALLGEYFRNRLGLPNGQFVTKEDLQKYGRTTVDFTRIDEEQYYMDFTQHVR
ncbi:restriction endonuclease PLD domain-containing protein [Bifidobacterium leontopitheci]|uniref:Restriction endonuclease n=1 Tax=Bifidobacterium leontopitheci TaxID=2650774 RepID=A0A6I1GDS0_9BIFI|nr:restriction endonuclease PLD domain-containing protein [Bifidobacterium leontopitheci]KAB7789675.1 restriction endonuclease [Bifidobacterium leontopitheci]